MIISREVVLASFVKLLPTLAQYLSGLYSDMWDKFLRSALIPFFDSTVALMSRMQRA